MDYLCRVLLPAVALDLLLGDPHCLPHPVRWMGACITRLEGALRSLFPQTPRGELLGGALLALSVPTLFGVGSWLLVRCCGLLHPWLRYGTEVWFAYQLLAARSLQVESMAVYRPLAAGDLSQARRRVSYIVGRDTQCLDSAGVTRAAVETVAENTSDGVVAPLLWLCLGGLPLGMVYKAVNTLDSMVGYQNDKYRYFGRVSARLDDVCNYIPARLAGVLMCLGACLLPDCSGRGAWRIFCRDRRCHKSPNSAHTEAACAGAMGVRLAGDASYFGTLVHKPTIGDDLRPVRAEDIPTSCRLMYATGALTLALAFALRLLADGVLG